MSLKLKSSFVYSLVFLTLCLRNECGCALSICNIIKNTITNWLPWGLCDQDTITETYDYRTEYSENLSKIYSRYLSDWSLNEDCTEKPQKIVITDQEFDEAFKGTQKELDKVKQLDIEALNAAPDFKRFDPFLHEAHLQANHMEFATKKLANNKCLSKLDVALNLSKIHQGVNNEYCDLERDVSPSVECDPKYKYQRLDGKCNNLKYTNWGAAYHCQRRLLPPDFSDGVKEPRAAVDGSPLPNSRLLSKQLFNEKPRVSTYTSLNSMWGQLIAHDTFSRIQYLGGGPDCCATNRSSIHPECLQVYLPPDELSIAFKQDCMFAMRTVACNSCRLGTRAQVNQVTSYLDLSNIYGLDQNTSLGLRTLTGGELRMSKALDGSDILPKAKLPEDLDIHEFVPCMPLAEKPWLTCFKNGDGIRGNQNPGATALVTIMVIRHNQHCRGLAKVNPQWDDEKLFQEARRLLRAEYNQINFGEYVPKFLTNDLIQKFDLKSNTNGFTNYDPNVDPSSIQSAGGAAFRFGHLTTASIFQVPTQPIYYSYGYRLYNKYMEMSDIWDGRKNDIIKGMTEAPENDMGANYMEDLQDYLFLDKCRPEIIDLFATNIQRGRDYGLPAYVYYLEYTSGVEIKGWGDLSEIIPQKYLDKLKKYYDDYRDIDLFVGQSLEKGVPTLQYLMAIQFYHWKFGDRFYFEHSGQSGSFTQEQLNEIRRRVSLANLLCKTTDFESITSNPLSVPSDSNRRVFCRDFKEINYNLFRE